MLYSLGQHRALEAIDRSLHPTETLMAFLDDCVRGDPGTRPRRCNLRFHPREYVGAFQYQDRRRETQVWNGAGVKPAICEVLDMVAQAADPEAKVWKGSEVPPNQQGLKILGAPFGHREFKTFQKQETLIRRIPLVPDLQSADLAALRQCQGKSLAQCG